MIDRLAEIKARLGRSVYSRGPSKDWTSPETWPAELQYVMADLDWAVGEVERLQRFEAMWEDACRHRDAAEARARRYQDLLHAIEVLVCPEEEPL